MIDKPRVLSNHNSLVANFELDIVQMLKWHWPKIALGLLLGWVGAAAYFLKTAPTYESGAEILLMPKDPRGLDNKRDVNSTLSDDLLATHLMLIQSQAIVGEALKKNGLSELPSLVEAMSDEDKTTSDYVIRKLSVSRGGKGKAKNAQVLQVGFRHGNAKDAKEVVQAIVDQFQTFINEKYTDVNEKAATLITKAQEQLKGDLERAEEDFRVFREDSPMLWNGESVTNTFRAEYEQVEAALTDLRMKRSELSSRLKLVETQLEKINASNGNELEKLALVDDNNSERIRVFLDIYGGKSDSQIFQSQQPERLEAARGQYEGLLQLKAKLQTLVSEFGAEHPEVKNARAQINTIEEFLKTRATSLRVTTDEFMLTPSKIVDAYVSLLRHDLRALDDRETLLVTSSTTAERKAKALVQDEIKGETLRLAIDRQKELYEATVDRLREINLAKDFGGFINELIRKPSVGEEVWPKLPTCLAIGSLLGLLAGAMIGLVFEFRSKSIRSVSDLEKLTKVGNVSLIPKLTTQLESKSRRAIRASGSKFASEIISYHLPQAKESEIFRGFRTSLLFKAGSSKAKIISVTSPGQGDGKSTVLSNLAVSLAQTGCRVLLIDADMRRPTISSKFGLQSKFGLSDLLQGKSTLFECVVDTEVPKLDIVTAGATPKNPAELLSSPAFKNLLETASSDYDYVLVDTPPVLSVADPCVIASFVDAILVVIRLNPKSRIEVKRTMELLGDFENRVLGTVVNASKIDSGSGRSDDYGVGYGYGTYGNRGAGYFREENSPSVNGKSAAFDKKSGQNKQRV